MSSTGTQNYTSPLILYMLDFALYVMAGIRFCLWMRGFSECTQARFRTALFHLHLMMAAQTSPVAAVPLLQKFGYPATVYLTTFYCQKRIPVFDPTLSYLLWRGRNCGTDLSAIVYASNPLFLSTQSERAASWQAIYEFTKTNGHGAEEKDHILRRISQAIGVDYNVLLRTGKLMIMAPEVVAKLPADLIDVQLHTHRHRTPRDRMLFCKEILENRAVIEDIIGYKHTHHFCYPSGDYWGEFLGWLPAVNVSFATTCIPHLASRRLHRLLLPRIMDSELLNPEIFHGWCSGIASFFPGKRENQLDQARLEQSSKIRFV